MIDNFDKSTSKKRCAIYTRKSCEEGLQQEFNSLDAQRLSAENYILSQEHEGWVLDPTFYDDGGFSGGTLERPALQRLFADIKDEKIDCIIVYKIDRLTRSLADFSEIIKILDEYNVSFVAVTQSFNTANSMGRLMLNVLLSFAQYERELTGERIRDKFAASCQKGMWMGGYIPIGYDLKDRRLIINEEEARIIRYLYETFIVTTSVTETFRKLNDLGFTSKSWISSNGKIHKGKKFNKGSVRRILENYLYIGKIDHKGKIYEGLHKAIINNDIWQKSREILSSRQNKISMPNLRITQAPLLKGIMNCGVCNAKMTPTYTAKQGLKYRYYICASKEKGRNDNCSVGRVTATETERLVTREILNLLKKPEFIMHTINKAEDIAEGTVIESFKKIDKIWDELFPVEQARIINLLVKEITITPEGLNINIYKKGLHSLSTELTN
jgi:DNA invertase Pin-like site-specific DNA recombinase